MVLAPGFFDGVQIQRRWVAAGGLRFLRLYRRLQVLAQGCAFTLIEGLRTLTLNIQQVFQRPEQPAKHRDDHNVVNGDRQQRLHDEKILRVQALAGQQQLRQRNNRQNRAELDDGDVFVNQRGQGNTKRLRDNN